MRMEDEGTLAPARPPKTVPETWPRGAEEGERKAGSKHIKS
jgi:hypothetical protein